MRRYSRRCLPTVLAALLCALCGDARTGGYVWWEGEKPVRTNFPAKTWFSTGAIAGKGDVLSGSAWLTSEGKRGAAELFATYRVDVPAEGSYSLWARKFWKHGPFRWRFGGGQWRTCGRDVALADSAEIRTHLCVNWVHLGKVKLARGGNDFELRLLAKEGEGATACFDCFLLIQGPFLPSGKGKPGQRSGRADEGSFAFEPPLDHFGPEALLDLAGLNEKVAGQGGFVRGDGSRFVLGGGKPVRFWAVNVSSANAAQSRDSVDYLARKLAKLGVNMVRYHSPIFDSARVGRADPRKLDDLHYLVAALKARGIYTTLSFYFPLWFDAGAAPGLAGYEGIKNKKPFALLYFEPTMQRMYKGWAKALLTAPNPYTKLPLGQDPAVAIVEIVNEDSYFFWTFSEKNVPAPYWRKLEGIYAKWLQRRYGSLAKAFAAWGSARHGHDSAAGGVAGLFDAWHMTRAGLARGGPDKARRISDQVRFLTEHQRGFYSSMAEHFRKDLGLKGLISASNWHVADAGMLDALERYTYTAGDVIDRHGYFSGPHTGDGASYSVRAGHTFTDKAAVTHPAGLPIQVHQVAGYPHIISELGWTNPNRLRADATFLASAYGALQGIDGLYFFAVGSNFLADRSMRKFAVGSPITAGTFPAAALQYRRGDVAEPPPVLTHHLAVEDLLGLSGSPAAAAEALDELRKRDLPSRRRPGSPASFDPLSFYVGPVVRAFGKAAPPQGTTGEHIDRAAKTVRSVTGELRWDYGVGRVTVNTPRSQGAAGFLAKAGEVRLADVTIDCRNEFASVMVISLDGAPLRRSKRILIQAMTEERPYSFRVSGGRIADLGAAPFGVRRIAATLSLRLTDLAGATVTALDENGYATARTVRTTARRGALIVNLAPDAVYHVLRGK